MASNPAAPLASVPNIPDPRLRKELTLQGNITQGKSSRARLVQELLVLNGHSLVIDGDYGPATAQALGDFANAPDPLNSVSQTLLLNLAAPLIAAVQPVAKQATLGSTAIEIAKQHVAQKPREVGGANRGPWVRMYMGGKDGPEFLWCAGFVTYILDTAGALHGVKSPIPRTFSCDVIGFDAQKRERLDRAPDLARVNPGDLFLIPTKGSKNDWNHVGLVERVAGEVLRTIEGNTNDEGSREGFEACARTRKPAIVNIVHL